MSFVLRSHALVDVRPEMVRFRVLVHSEIFVERVKNLFFVFSCALLLLLLLFIIIIIIIIIIITSSRRDDLGGCDEK